MEPTTRIPPPSTLDILIQRPHLRLSNATTILHLPNMTTRSADEAELPNEREDRDATRPRTEDTPNGNTAPVITRDEGMKALDILTYIRHPPLNPIQIQGWDAIKALENISEAQRNIWTDATEAKVLTYKAYRGKIEDREDIIKVRELIRKSLKITTNPTISPPAPKVNLGKKDTFPFCALVRGISPEKVQELIEKVCPTHPAQYNKNANIHPKRFISTKEITIMFVPFKPPPSPFVTSIRGFIFIDETFEQTETAVTNIVMNAMFADTSGSALPTIVRRFIANHRDNIPDTIKDIEDAIRFIRTSIIVKRIDLVKKEDIGTGEGRAQPVWNVYIFPPSKDEEAMREWRAYLRRTVFVTDSNGAGRTTKTFSCTTCRSEDHPSGMCPYPDQQDWKTPTPTTSTVVEAILGPTHNTRENRTGNCGGRGSQMNGRGKNAISRRGRN